MSYQGPSSRLYVRQWTARGDTSPLHNTRVYAEENEGRTCFIQLLENNRDCRYVAIMNP